MLNGEIERVRKQGWCLVFGCDLRGSTPKLEVGEEDVHRLGQAIASFRFVSRSFV
jgi:hypothetical protein